MKLLLKSFGLALLFWAGIAGFVAIVAGLLLGIIWWTTDCPRPLAYAIGAAMVLAFSTVVIYLHKTIHS